MEWCVTEKGKRLLILNGYSYTFEKHGVDDKVFWRCRDRSCKGRLHTRGERIAVDPSEHNHVPSYSKLSATKAVAAIKRRAKDSEESSSTIVNNTLQTVPLKLSNELPSKSNLLKLIRRQREIPCCQERISTELLMSSE